jgi:hypothetical protein
MFYFSPVDSSSFQETVRTWKAIVFSMRSLVVAITHDVQSLHTLGVSSLLLYRIDALIYFSPTITVL